MNAAVTSTPAQGRRKRILFFAEAVTLAHVARPLVLAQGLPEADYEPILAVDGRYEKLYATSRVPRIAINSISTAQFAAALAKGKPIYSVKELEQYVQQDLEVIQSVRPDIVVGDMRLSLAVSTKLAGVPYLNLTNSYWSPYAQVRFPVPQIPLTRFVNIGTAQMLFDLVRPMVFSLHTRPLNRVLKNHQLPSLGNNLQRVYSNADHVLYADLPGLTAMAYLPDNHHFLGPILWEPDLPKPAWWDALCKTSQVNGEGSHAQSSPIVYVNLGSSGPSNLLAMVLEGLKDLPVTVIAATAGKTHIANPPANAKIADFLPGLQACVLANLVICNGGSPSTQQAIAAGKPMLCLPSNLDQFLNTQGLIKAGVARQIRADRVSAATIKHQISQLLTDTYCREQASVLQERACSHKAVDVFTRIVKDIIGQQ